METDCLYKKHDDKDSARQRFVEEDHGGVSVLYIQHRVKNDVREPLFCFATTGTWLAFFLVNDFSTDRSLSCVCQ